MPDIVSGIHHIGIVVSDLEKAKDFYERVFGFELVMVDTWEQGCSGIDACVGLQDSAARGYMMRGANTYIELWEYVSPEAKGGTPKERNANDLGLAHVCFQITNFDEVHNRLLEAGGHYIEPVPENIYDLPRCHYFRDPFGNIIELLEFTDDEFPRLRHLRGISGEGRFAEKQDDYLLIRNGKLDGRIKK